MAVDSHDFWITAGTSMGLGGVFGSISTILIALVRHRGSMSALIDARIRILIESYEKRIAELQSEIDKLEQKVDALDTALAEARSQRVVGL
jgi:uncharacterized protein Yka (UPF0111/DUF47 family)